jgi:hypothetical protein
MVTLGWTGNVWEEANLGLKLYFPLKEVCQFLASFCGQDKLDHALFYKAKKMLPPDHPLPRWTIMNDNHKPRLDEAAKLQSDEDLMKPGTLPTISATGLWSAQPYNTSQFGYEDKDVRRNTSGHLEWPWGDHKLSSIRVGWPTPSRPCLLRRKPIHLIIHNSETSKGLKNSLLYLSTKS